MTSTTERLFPHYRADDLESTRKHLHITIGNLLHAIKRAEVVADTEQISICSIKNAQRFAELPYPCDETYDRILLNGADGDLLIRTTPSSFHDSWADWEKLRLDTLTLQAMAEVSTALATLLARHPR